MNPDPEDQPQLFPDHLAGDPGPDYARGINTPGTRPRKRYKLSTEAERQKGRKRRAKYGAKYRAYMKRYMAERRQSAKLRGR